MLQVVKSAITGHYTPQGKIEDADSLITQDFGRRERKGDEAVDPVNMAIAQFAIDILTQKDMPSIMQTESATAYNALSRKTASKIITESRKKSQAYLDSWEVLSQAKEYMDEYGLESPVIVAQAHHIGRVALMAVKLGIKPIIPKGLPNGFDNYSAQWWTRTNSLWMAREVPGLYVLKVQGKL